MFLAVLIFTLILCAIRPFLNTISMLFIFKPLTNICSSIGMLISTMSMSFIIQPLSLVNITISMNESSMAVCLITLPLSIVFRSILPDLLAVSIFHAIKEFSSVYSSVTQGKRTISRSLIAISHFVCDTVCLGSSLILSIIKSSHHASATHHLSHYWIAVVHSCDAVHLLLLPIHHLLIFHIIKVHLRTVLSLV